MDTRTGDLLDGKEAMSLIDAGLRGVDELVKVDNKDMTVKQRENRQVSKFDNKSKLGKKFAAARYQRRYHFK